MNYINIEEISKSYNKSITALHNISLHINKNELFGFIGPDGAGKTTLFRIIVTLLLADKGKVEMNGLDVVKDYKKIRKILGYMPGRFSLYQDLSIEENLKFFASIFNTRLEDNYDLIKDIYTQIEPFKKRRAGKLSGGMKQKLALCCALIHKPEILVLDEPTTGVDAVSRKEFWEMLQRLQTQGITIIVSTPYMDEASLCDRVCLIQKGKILDINSPKAIVENAKMNLYAIKDSNKYNLIKALKNYNFAHSVQTFGDSIHYIDNRENFNPEELKQYLILNNIKATIEPIKPNIEDVFISLMIKQEDNG